MVLRSIQQVGMFAHNPHALLGLHDTTIRLWRPGAEEIFLEVKGKIVGATLVQEEGLFVYELKESIAPTDYRIYHASGLLAHDPYAFLPTIGPVDEHLFNRGVHYKLYEVLGAKICRVDGVRGVRFALWAPCAKRVSVIADFNRFDGRVNVMRMMGSSGIWELFVPGIDVGEKYKFEITSEQDELLVKADPFAYSSELRPKTASVVCDIDQFSWEDQGFIEQRGRQKEGPMLVYEVHLGSWKRSHGDFMNYKEIAHTLAIYCKEMGFTHVEFLPLAEHPLDESWGYQVTGFYAVTSRFGSPQDFQYLVNYLHLQNIKIILDWVPAHFPTDGFALSRFDGSYLFEPQDERRGFHPHWNTCIFNYGRYEVANFLIANALFWFDKMHIDGLRVDAVASMLYLDYGREHGNWLANPYGGNENLEAIEFIKHLNSIVHEKFAGVLMIAEESTAFRGVSHSLANGGLGFDLKWNMGWMHDTLLYFSKDPVFRSHHHNNLTFGLLYAFSEHFVLPFSHDEVTHGKGSLLAKMPGGYEEKFAQMRLLYSYMICQPGKKLLFMGAEIGQWNEWSCKSEVEWFLLQFPIHADLQRLVREMNHFYLAQEALWGCDFQPEGFSWVDFFDHRGSVISYLRRANRKELLCVHNFTPIYHERYFIRLGNLHLVKEIFNSDEERFHGSGKVRGSIDIVSDGFHTTLAPLSTQIYHIEHRA